MLACSPHHGFLHAVFSRPIQADFVPIRIIQVGVPPTPGHHARQFRNEKAFLLEFLAEVVEIADFEVQAHAIARKGIAWIC